LKDSPVADTRLEPANGSRRQLINDVFNQDV